MKLHRNALARACRVGLGGVGLALLAACGGGGSSHRAEAAPPPPPPIPPPTSEPSPQPAADTHLALTNTAAAHEEGYTGAGITIGVIDSGIRQDHPSLSGRVTSSYIYIDPASNNTNVDDVVGHGTIVSMIAGGTALDLWPGGIAPGAEFVSARIISDAPPEDDGSGQGNEVSDGSWLRFVHDDLMTGGARISNNSWGGLYWDGDEVTTTFVEAMKPFVVDWGGLVVFATGNESRANPSDNAALPSQGAGAGILEQGWLAVAALSSHNPTVLSDYSNACGIAMNYCLVAPGEVVFPDPETTASDPQFQYGGGTSFAAPQVSGAAALVWEAFPYFTNDMVRQTLLGNAIDLGDPGVDPVFGHGLLNVGSAVLGPSRLEWGQAIADFDDVTSVWSNIISGEGGITKRGTGRLELTEQNSYSGETRIEEGTLASVFDLPGDVFVGTGANFEWAPNFYGGVRGNLENLGTLSLLNGAGQHPMDGNYYHAASARLALNIGAFLNVSGSAQLDGGEVHVLGIAEGYATSEREKILVAADGLSGEFDKLTWADGVFLEATSSYDSTTAWLDIERLEVAATAQALGLSPTAVASAARIEGAFQQIDAGAGQIPGAGGASGFVSGASAIQRSPTAAAAEQTLASLSGEMHGADTAFAMMAIEGSRHALESRLDAVGDGVAAGAWANRLDGERSMWSHTRLDANGWMLGHDRHYGPNLMVGAAFGQTDGYASHDLRGDRERNRQLEGQVYATWNDDGGNYLLGRVALGHMDRWMQRDILLGSERFGVDAQYDNRYSTVGVQAGHRFELAGGTLTPYVGAQSLQLDRDGFSEQGAAGFGLSTHDSHLSATQALAGARLERQWSVGATRLSLQGRLEWQRTLSQSGQAIDARFTGMDVWSPITGAGLGEEAAVFGVGLRAWLPIGGQLGFDLDSRRENGRTYTGAFANWSIGF